MQSCLLCTVYCVQYGCIVLYIPTTDYRCGLCEVYVFVEDRDCEEISLGHEANKVWSYGKTEGGTN